MISTGTAAQPEPLSLARGEAKLDPPAYMTDSPMVLRAVVEFVPVEEGVVPAGRNRQKGEKHRPRLHRAIISRSRNFSTLPVAVRGSSSTNSSRAGIFCLEIR